MKRIENRNPWHTPLDTVRLGRGNTNGFAAGRPGCSLAAILITMARIGLAVTFAAVVFSIFAAFQLSLTFFFPESNSFFSFSSLTSSQVTTEDGGYVLGVGKADITG